MTPDPIEPGGLDPLALTQALHDSVLLAELYNDLRAALPGYDKVDRYMKGKHDLAFATEKFQNAFGQLFREFANNYCPQVVSIPCDRLQLECVDVGDEDLQKEVDAWLDEQNAPHLAGKVHNAGFRYGNGYLILAQTADGEYRLYDQNPANLRVLYDPEEPTQIHLAIKLWRQLDKRWRLNVYQRGSTLRFLSTQAPPAGAHTASSAQAELPAGLRAFAAYDGDDIGPVLTHRVPVCPVFHYANEAGWDGIGDTELTDVYPLQDALNKSICDLLVGAEYHALPQRYATGIEIDYDDDGKPKAPFLSDTQRLWYSGKEGVDFGQFNAADLSQLIEVGESFRKEIARVARIPLHFLTIGQTTFPSGEALKTAEAPLMAKVKDRQIAWGAVWVRVVKLWLLLSGRMAEGDKRAVKAKWVDTSPRSEKEEAEAEQTQVDTIVTKVKELGVSRQQGQRELGYSDRKIEEMAEEREQEALDASEQLATAFDQGAGLSPAGAAAPLPGRSRRAFSLRARNNAQGEDIA
jgi:hypothetical protein